jgi:apolipoprotein N-acyltransferase
MALAKMKLVWRLLIAFLLGLLSAGAFAPLYLVPLLIPAFAGLLLLLEAPSRWPKTLAVAWAFGFGQMLGGLYWIGIAFLVEAEVFAAIMPAAVALLCFGMAVFPALSVLLAKILTSAPGARLVMLASAWLLGEWLRSWVFTGFPWNLMGSVWAFDAAALQPAALGGVWLLSFMTILAAGAPALLALPCRRQDRRRRIAACAVLMALPLIGWAGGAIRLEAAGGEAGDGVRLRLVQAAIAQDQKWQADQIAGHIKRQIEMSQSAEGQEPDLVIWPETAIPLLVERNPDWLPLLAEAVPKGGYLLAGAPRLTQDGEAGQPVRLWNSLRVFGPEARLLSNYDKRHLVPFGEYLPLRGLLGLIGLQKITAGRLDFSAGSGAKTMMLPGLPAFSPLICYEIIFSGAVVAKNSPRPAWLLNVTNDAWFGVSSGPYQHLASARLRAVEEGLPVVRVANTGISAVIDAHGKIRHSLELNRAGVIDGELPPALTNPTLYAELGTLWIVLLIGLGSAYSLILHRFLG